MTAMLEERVTVPAARTMTNGLHVVIAGAGPAAVEAALRLRRAAGHAIRLTIVAPEPRFLALPPAAAAPFGIGCARRSPLADRLAPVVLMPGTVRGVRCDRQQLELDAGHLINYDALLVAVGGRQRSPFRRGLAYGTPASEERMHGLIQDVEAGYVKRIAWIVPPGTSWPLPLYELALMTAERAFDMCADVESTLITTEPRVLDILGDAVSDAMTRALDAARIAVHVSDEAVMRDSRTLQLRRTEQRLQVDRVVTLPILDGPQLAGLPHDAAGFIVADRYGRVDGAPGVYVAGDATAGSIKQGAIACQQADVVADAILADAGMQAELRPFAPVLRGEILTARGARRFVRDLGDGSGQDGEDTWDWSKFAGRELSTLLSETRSRR